MLFKKFVLIFPFGILGAFAAIVLGGSCVWSLSVAPDFFLMDFIIYLFPLPLVIGVVASLASMGIANTYGRINQKTNTFWFAFLSTFFTLPTTPILGSYLLESSNLIQRQVVALHLLVGLIIIGIVALIKVSFLQIQEMRNNIDSGG